MLYLYALLGAQPSTTPEGIRVLQCGPILAAVADVEAAPALDEGSLRGHERVVRELANHVDAILPIRFGSSIPNETILRELLERRETELCPALEMVAGREQMTLRVYGAESHAAQPDADNSLGPGSRYLAKKVREQDITGLSAVQQRLGTLIKAERIQRHGKPPLLASVYHLIERGRSAEYLTALDCANADSSSKVQFAASGPWPPYAFGRWEEA